MFSQLPKLLGRNFVIGFLLPATLFVLAHFIVLEQYGRLEDSGLVALSAENPWLAATGATVVIGLLALTLMLMNRSLIRVKEGYGWLERVWNPFMAYQQWKWKRLHRLLDAVDEDIEAAGKTPSRMLRARQIRLHGRAANEFPDTETWLLPTAFGNAIRAFEVYPRVMYGLDAISGWTRLLAVVPKDFRDQVDSARSLVDLWVNTWALGLIFAAECIFFGNVCEDLPTWALAGLAFLVAWLSSRQARSAAIEWGEFVKSAFDVFLPALAEKLKLVDGEDTEQPLWWGFSQAITYREPTALPATRPQRDDQPPKDHGTRMADVLLATIGLGTLLLLPFVRQDSHRRDKK